MQPIKTLKLIPLLLLLLFISCSSSQEADSRKQKVEIGKKAPDFTLTDTTGKSWSLAALKGSVVFLNFWATWCPPCREEMPSMERLRQKMSGEKLVMLTILSNDNPAAATSLAEKIGFHFPILLDPESTVAKSYGLTGVPETFIIDTGSVLRRVFIGGHPWDSPAAIEMLREYLPAKN